MFENTPKLKNVIESFKHVMGYAVNVPITDMFKAKSLEVIRNSFIFGENDYSDATIMIGNSLFNGIKDTIRVIEGSFGGIGLKKVINYEDCNGKDFPYDILSGCTQLETFSDFFNGVSGKTDVVVDLPSENMFSTCTALKSVKNCFDGIKIPYRLKADCFADSTIENFENAFADGNGMRVGMIPYHMLYQKAGNVITNMKGCFSNQQSKKLAPYSLSGQTDEYIKKYIYVTEGGKNKWNEKFADGSLWFKEKADAFRTENADLNLPRDYPDTFIPNGQESYDPSDFNMGVENVEGAYARLNTSNYFCPPDIFAYCKNETTTNIDGCFQGSSRNDGEWLTKGFFGRIPSCIFKPLSNIQSIDGVLQGLHFTPTKWGIKNTENYGILIPSSLFASFTGIKTMQSLFADTNIWGMTTIPSDLFANCGSLQNISSMWRNSRWLGNVGAGTAQLPSGLFNNCPSLIKVSSLFESSNVTLSQNLFRFIYNPKIYDVSNFLYGSDGNGTLIKWWNDWTIVLKAQCYANISETAFENYAECKTEAPSYFV